MADILKSWLGHTRHDQAYHPHSVCRRLSYALEHNANVAGVGLQDPSLLRLHLAHCLLAADHPVEAAERIEQIADGMQDDAAAAVWWLARARLAESRPELPWPPTGSLTGCVSDLVRVWTTAHVWLERGTNREQEQAAMDDLVEFLQQREDGDASPFELAFGEALSALRVVEERPPLALLAQSFLAAYHYRAGRFDKARDAYRGLAERTNGQYPALSWDAARAGALAEVRRDGNPFERWTLNERMAESARALAVRRDVILTVYEEAARLDADRDLAQIRERAERIASLLFGDRLAGALEEVRRESVAWGHALTHKRLWSEGFDFLLDGLRADEIRRAVELTRWGLVPDGERIRTQRHWRARRGVTGCADAYAALGEWMVPLLDPEAGAEQEDAADWARLQELSDTGSRSAIRALAGTLTVAAGARGRNHAEALARIAMDPRHPLAVRHDCVGFLQGYWEDALDPEELDGEWLRELGLMMVQAVSGTQARLDERLILFLGQVVYVCRKLGESPESLAKHVMELAEQRIEDPEPVERSRKLLWLKCALRLSSGGVIAPEAFEQCVAWVEERRLNARDGGVLRAGYGVSLGLYDPLYCLHTGLIWGTIEQRERAGRHMELYARESYLSDDHRVVALVLLRDAARDAGCLDRAQRRALADLAVDIAGEPIESHTLLGTAGPGKLQVAAVGLLAATMQDIEAGFVPRVIELLMSSRGLLRDLELARLLGYCGETFEQLQGPLAERIAGWMLRETEHRSPVRACGAWAGLLSGAIAMKEEQRTKLEEYAVETLRGSATPFRVRCTIVAQLAALATNGRDAFGKLALHEIIAIAGRDPFWEARYYGRLLDKHTAPRTRSH
jgi:tetratricopeptide (TPR) repeat protein